MTCIIYRVVWYYEEKGMAKSSYLFLPLATRVDGGKYRPVMFSLSIY
jgi:hypothetical protein